MNQLVGQNLNTRILDTDIKISGTFGEFRGNHFHAGIDYKTEKKEGIPIYAADDGYVFRILVSRSGYGKALYINHKNNLTTVYAHLRDFDGSIADTVWRIQKKQKHFELDHRPAHQKIKVKKGELIGYSGNTGSSEGPHLHFETRHTQSEKPFDPVTVGFSFEDRTAPVLETIWVYPVQSNTISYPLPTPIGYNGHANSDTISVHGSFMIGLSAYDLAGSEKNRLGIHKAKLYMNDQLLVSFQINPFEFHQSKEITGIQDQGLRLKGIQSFLMHAAQNLTIPFFDENRSNGILNLTDDSIHRMNIELEDVMGNRNTYAYHFKKATIHPPVQPEKSDCGHLLPGNDTTFRVEEFKGEIDSGSLLGPSCIQLEQIKIENSWSSRFSIGSASIPLLKPIKIHFKLDSTNAQLDKQLMVVRLDKNNNAVSLGGKIQNGWMVASSSSLGTFQLMADTTAPDFGEPTYFEDELTGKKALALELQDNLSGVDVFRCQVNGRWVYSEYYPSRKMLIIYDIEKNKGDTLEIKAVDKSNNTSKKRIQIEP